MIKLIPGNYSRQQMLEMDIGTNKLPTTKLDVVISNSYGYGVPSYRISKFRVPVVDRKKYDNNCYAYKIEVLFPIPHPYSS